MAADWAGERRAGSSTSRRQVTTKTVRLRKPVTLYFAYVTAWATQDGVIQFRPDIYQKDGVGEVAAAY